MEGQACWKALFTVELFFEELLLGLTVGMRWFGVGERGGGRDKLRTGR